MTASQKKKIFDLIHKTCSHPPMAFKCCIIESKRSEFANSTRIWQQPPSGTVICRLRRWSVIKTIRSVHEICLIEVN